MKPRYNPNIYNRVLIFLSHTDRYAFKGQSRVARDAGSSKSAISRLVRDRCAPLFVTVMRITTRLERVIKKKIDSHHTLLKTKSRQ